MLFLTTDDAWDEVRDRSVLGNVMSSHLIFQDILIISASKRIFLECKRTRDKKVIWVSNVFSVIKKRDTEEISTTIKCLAKFWMQIDRIQLYNVYQVLARFKQNVCNYINPLSRLRLSTISLHTTDNISLLLAKS